MKPKEKHATVPLGEYLVPLIGVSPDATQETCARCGQKQHLKDMTLDARGQPLCAECLKKVHHETSTQRRRPSA